jgi:hypothetical protein
MQTSIAKELANKVRQITKCKIQKTPNATLFCSSWGKNAGAKWI